MSTSFLSTGRKVALAAAGVAGGGAALLYAQGAAHVASLERERRDVETKVRLCGAVLRVMC